MPKKKTQEEVVREIEEKFPGKFDLSKFEYYGSQKKSIIICKKCDSELEIKPNDIFSGYGCKKCGYTNNGMNSRKTQEEVVREIEEKFPGKFDLSKFEYYGKIKKDIVDFYYDLEEKFPGKFDLSEFEYKNSKTKSTIICNKCFHKWVVRPNDVMNGKGCPKCNQSKGEEKTESVLKNISIIFKTQYRIDDCCHKNTLPFDFAIFDTSDNILGLVEYQGKQHFIPVNFSGKLSEETINNNLKSVQLRDQIKREYCQTNGIPLLELRYDEDEKLEENLMNFLKKIGATLCNFFGEPNPEKSCH